MQKLIATAAPSGAARRRLRCRVRRNATRRHFRMTRLVRFALLTATLLLSGCGFLVIHGVRHAMSAYSSKDGEAVDAALARYRTLTLDGKTDQLPDLFDGTGEVSHDDQTPIAGRAALATFFKS